MAVSVMDEELRGRPRLNIATSVITEAVRRHGTVMAAARDLGSSDCGFILYLVKARFRIPALRCLLAFRLGSLNQRIS